MSDEEAAQIAAGGPGRDRDPGVLTARTAMGADWFVAVAPMLREVRAMGLTWRDLVSSAALVAMIVAYWALKFRYGPPIISTAWATSAVELVLGSICAVTAAIDLHTRPQPRAGRIVRRITTAFGSIALVAGLAGLVGNSAHAVEILLVATVWLWLAATLWHVYTIGFEA